MSDAGATARAGQDHGRLRDLRRRRARRHASPDAPQLRAQRAARPVADEGRVAGGSRTRTSTQLRRIQQLTSEGHNLEGVRRILELEREIDLAPRRARGAARRRRRAPSKRRTAPTAATSCRCARRRCVWRRRPRRRAAMTLDPTSAGRPGRRRRSTTALAQATARPARRGHRGAPAERDPRPARGHRAPAARPGRRRRDRRGTEARRRSSRRCRARSAALTPELSRAAREGLERADAIARGHEVTTTSRSTTCCSRSRRRSARRPRPCSARCATIRGSARITSADPEGTFQSLEQVRPRPHRARPRGTARPGHRSRRGGAPGRPGALAAHEEQPGAHRRAGRRQDSDRRGAGAAHRGGRRPRVAPRATRSSRSTSARWSRARSSAASSRSG